MNSNGGRIATAGAQHLPGCFVIRSRRRISLGESRRRRPVQSRVPAANELCRRGGTDKRVRSAKTLRRFSRHRLSEFAAVSTQAALPQVDNSDRSNIPPTVETFDSPAENPPPRIRERSNRNHPPPPHPARTPRRSDRRLDCPPDGTIRSSKPTLPSLDTLRGSNARAARPARQSSGTERAPPRPPSGRVCMRSHFSDTVATRGLSSKR